jgi:4a-hydroxytetrahydrobiopterin dehydratase
LIKLTNRVCVPCKGGIPPLKGKKLKTLQNQLGNGWNVIDEHHLEKEWKLNDFLTALDITNRIGSLAEEQGHHPNIYLAWGKVGIKLWTHKIDGLTDSDFILAAKIDSII